MGGKEASRGFLYQAFASVLELLCQKNWDKIYIELSSANDKVDIALEENGKIIKCIQVKSTINSFSKDSIVKWMQDLIKDDVGAKEFELFLIGQCDKNAVTFINSIDKFQSHKLDDKAKASLKGFNTELIHGKKMKFTCIPYDIEILEKIVRDSLFKYVSHTNQIMSFEQISFIASATVNDQMISSTHGKGIARNIFDEELEKRILLVADKYFSKRISIGVKSFICESSGPEDIKLCLSLAEMFNDRKIKGGYNWNRDIYEKLKNFLLTNTTTKQAYQIFLYAHLSIAFAAGRILNSKSGINIFPMQKTATNGIMLWNIEPLSKRRYPDWNFSLEMYEKNEYDTALILNVTHNIYNSVIEFINEKKLPIGRIINCKLSEGGATNFSIQDGTHAAILANSIYNAIEQRTIQERRAKLHIFAAAPGGFMFFLGQTSMGFGKCVLYEYDFEHQNSCSYLQSLIFAN